MAMIYNHSDDVNVKPIPRDNITNLVALSPPVNEARFLVLLSFGAFAGEDAGLPSPVAVAVAVAVAAGVPVVAVAVT